ncbi:KH domain-containing protein [candidate division WOR-3 bacterium]|nr:KH domain-containing protein [candidate division WOR-3 bacterium]
MNNSNQTVQELVEFVARKLVDTPDDVRVTSTDHQKTVYLELKVGSGDLGKIIGKEGRTAKALRHIVSAAAMKTGKRAILEILD